MRTLVIETATAACSVALFEGETLLGHHHQVLGRGHAEALVPAIAALPDRGRAERILVSLGPGSFTGTRIGIATARALAIAWASEVRGYPTPALLAAQLAPGMPCLVATTGGHGEWFCQPFDEHGRPVAECRSLTPDQAAAGFAQGLVVGDRAPELVERRGSGDARAGLPDARHALAVPREVLTEALAPIYGRPPDARLPGA